jgi:hypothetical protein
MVNIHALQSPQPSVRIEYWCDVQYKLNTLSQKPWAFS